MEAKEMDVLTSAQIKDLPKGALARKYKTSPQYVYQILKGIRGKSRSYVADRIREDANAILIILKD